MEIDLDTEFKKFLTQLDLEDNIKKQIFFVQNEYFLKDTISFYQYILDKKKLVTLIGEYHNLQFGCNRRDITIADYCLHEVMRNSRCLVLLEYNLADNPEIMRSDAIYQTWNALKAAGKESQIFPYDFRPWFLFGGLQAELYSDKVITNYTLYIDPFYQTKMNNGASPFDLVPNDYNEKNLGFMYKYFSEINTEFTRLVGLHNKNKHHNDLRQSLKKVWAQVCDYFVLRELLKRDSPFDDFIIISGEHHRTNLSEKLQRVDSQLVTEQKGRPNDCVNLFQTYYI